MRVEVQMRDGSTKILESDGYVLFAEPNDHGDLIVYRNHINMITPQPIASFAAGEWVFQEIVT